MQPKLSDTVVIQELLAFLQNKIDSMDEVTLEKICKSSFTEQEILEAKNLLIGTVKPNLIDARIKDEQIQNNLQDIVYVFKNANPDDIPIYVARDLSNLPSMIFENADLRNLLHEVKSLKTEVGLMNVKLENSERIGAELKKEVLILRSELSLLRSENKNQNGMTDTESVTNILSSLKTEIELMKKKFERSERTTENLKQEVLLLRSEHLSSSRNITVDEDELKIDSVTQVNDSVDQNELRQINNVTNTHLQVQDIDPIETSPPKNITFMTQSNKKLPQELQPSKRRYVKKISRYRTRHRPYVTSNDEIQLQKTSKNEDNKANFPSEADNYGKKIRSRCKLKVCDATGIKDFPSSVPSLLLYVSASDLQSASIVVQTNSEKTSAPQIKDNCSLAKDKRRSRRNRNRNGLKMWM